MPFAAAHSYIAHIWQYPPGLYSILCLNLNFIFLKGAKLLRGNPRPKLQGTVTGALNYQQAHTKFLPIRCYTPAQPSDVHAKLYPHRGTMGRGRGGGVGVDGSSPYFDFGFSGKAFDLNSLQDEVYFMRGGSAKGL